MKIKEISFKNFCSYGNKMQSITFNDKPELILIQGNNGFGKSTIGNVLEFAIYGKSSRRSIKNLASWINGNAESYIKFETDDQHVVEISRGIKPDHFDLRINDKYLNSGSTENLSGKVALDKMIENELVNIPFDVYTNNIILSIKDFKSFINLKREDKRKIIDKIFEMTILNTMNDLLKQDLSQYNSELLMVDAEIREKNTVIEKYELEIQSISANIIGEIDEAITLAEGLLLEKNTVLKKHKTDVTEINLFLDKLNDSRISIANEIQKHVSELEAEYAKETMLTESIHDKAFDEKILKITESYNFEMAKLDDSIAVQKKEILDEEKQKIADAKMLCDGKINDLSEKTKDKLLCIDTAFNDKVDALKKDTDLILKKLTKKRNAYLDSEAKLTKEHADLVLEINMLNKDISDTQEKIKLYDSGICDRCGTDLKDNDHEIYKEQMKQSIIDMSVKIDALLADADKKQKIIVSTKTDAENTLIEYNQAVSMSSKKESDMTSELKLSKNVIDQDHATLRDKIVQDYNGVCKEIHDEQEEHLLKIEELRMASATKINEAFTKDNNEIYGVVSKEKDNALRLINEKYGEKINMVKSDKRIDEAIEKITILSTKKLVNESSAITLESDISGIEAQIDAFKKKKESNATIDMFNNIIQQNRDALDGAMNRKSCIELDIWKCKQTQLMLTEDGLKRVLMRQALPMFNESIAQLTKELNFKYDFQFDDEFDPMITYLGNEISADAVSSGEEAIMDIIIVLSTLKFIMMKHPKMNVLFLDEIFSNLSMENISNIIGILRKYIDEKSMTIFIISHIPVPIDKMDRTITVKYENCFSELTIK